MGEVIRVGLLGCGNVGSALVRLVDENADAHRRRGPASGSQVDACRGPRSPRRAATSSLAPDVFTDDPRSVVVADPTSTSSSR